MGHKILILRPAAHELSSIEEASRPKLENGQDNFLRMFEPKYRKALIVTSGEERRGKAMAVTNKLIQSGIVHRDQVTVVHEEEKTQIMKKINQVKSQMRDEKNNQSLLLYCNREVIEQADGLNVPCKLGQEDKVYPLEHHVRLMRVQP